MNSARRIMAALQGQAWDRRPWTAVLSLYGARLTSCPLRQYYSDPGAYAAGQAAVLERFAPDMLFAPFAVPLLAEAFGGELKYLENQAPNLRRPAVASIRDLAGLAAPDIDASGPLVYQRAALRMMLETVGKNVPIAAVALSPFDLPAMILGAEAWFDTVLFEPAEIPRVLELTEPFAVRWVNALLGDGAACIVLPGVFTSPKMVPVEILTAHVLPVLRRFLEQVNGPVVLHHGGSRFLKFLPHLRDVGANVVAFGLDHRESLSAARTALGPGVAILGGIDGSTLHMTSPEAIRARSCELLAECEGDPRYILCTSGADVPMETPEAHIRALHDAVRTNE